MRFRCQGIYYICSKQALGPGRWKLVSTRLRRISSGFYLLMVDRIKALLQERQLSTTQFADLVGVARPIISHVLSGRNKPSLEVVQRILAAFPDLSMAWLLNGTGPMLAAGQAPAATTAAEPATVTAAASAASSYSLKAAQILEKEGVFVDSSAGLPLLAAVAPAPAAPVAPAAAPPVVAQNVPPVAAALPSLPMAAPRPLRQPTQRFALGVALGVAPAAAPVPPLPVAPCLPAPDAVLVPPAPQVTPPASAAPVPVAEPPVAPGIDPLPAAATAGAAAVPGKVIRRIVIFYQDGSFSDFAPE